MGVKIKGSFQGGVATKMTHCDSNADISTDAPKDNGGQGLSFSPTDLLATATGSCMMTIMALYARKKDLNLDGMHVEIEKHMTAELPRKVDRLDIDVHLPSQIEQNERAALEEAAMNCPVVLSLAASIQLCETFTYDV